MTVDYTFAPILLDASPIPSRFAAPLDSPTGSPRGSRTEGSP